MSELYIMITICDRKKLPRFVDYYSGNKIETGNISLGMGTASDDILDYLGLEEDEKGIHMAAVTANTWDAIKKGLWILEMEIRGFLLLQRHHPHPIFLFNISSLGVNCMRLQ